MSILKPNWNHEDIDSRKMKFFESKYNLRLESMKTDQNIHLMSDMHVDGFNLHYFDTDLSYEILNSKYSLSVAATGYTVIEFIDDSGAVVKRQSCKSYEVVR